MSKERVWGFIIVFSFLPGNNAVAITVSQLAGRHPEAGFSVRQVSSVETKARLRAELQQITSGGASIESAVSAVFRAGQSTDNDLIPLLKQVAQATSRGPVNENRYFTVCFHALYALWKLGEPKSYFLENAKSHQRNKTIAYWSAFILARDPDDATLKVLDEAEKEVRDSFTREDANIREGISRARFVRYHSEELAKIKDVKKKLPYLLRQIGAGCKVASALDNGPFSYWNSPTYGQDPLQVWARQLVTNLSMDNPQAAAEVVFRINMKNDLGFDSNSVRPACGTITNSQYRRFVASFLSGASRAALSKLEKSEQSQKRPTEQTRRSRVR